MKNLIFMRHGQASFGAMADHDRPLTPAGQEQARRAAQNLLRRNLRPTLLLASPLLRAQQTGQIVSEVLQVPLHTAFDLDGRLSAQGLVQWAQEQLNTADSVLLIGHNPNVSLAAGLLSGRYHSFGPGDWAAFDWTDPQHPKYLEEEK